MQTLAQGRITLDQYKSVLREIYHYSKEDPQIQALATVYFRGDDRGTVKMFLKHAISEIGHDRMALADLGLVSHSAGFRSPRTLWRVNRFWRTASCSQR